MNRALAQGFTAERDAGAEGCGLDVTGITAGLETRGAAVAVVFMVALRRWELSRLGIWVLK
jgi:hypothetical protein